MVRQGEETDVFLTGQDWETISARSDDDTIVVNMGPQHPSTHGVLRIVLELSGETVVHAHPVIGYLHTGIEKNTEVRNWTQGVLFVTRMDYLANFHNELGYSMAVERLLGIEVPPRAQAIRVMLCELQRIASHLVWVGTTGMELGALSMMLYGFRERELILDIFEWITGLRMNMGWIRPGGVPYDLPDGTLDKVRDFIAYFPSRLDEYNTLLTSNPTWVQRNEGVGYLPADVALSLGVTGPLLRAAGVPYDLRKQRPYSGYERYDFEVAVDDAADCLARYRVRMTEMRESLRIVQQVIDTLPDGPVLVDDPKIAWPARLTLGSDGLGQSPDHVRKIMGESMEALIHHFKLVTEGFKVARGEVYVPIESPRGELGYHVASSGGTKPWRVHVRDPSFVNLQCLSHMVEGGLVADVVACIASIDPVMGGVDR